MIDHDARRRWISRAMISVLAREGLNGATIRRVAAELGGPTKAVTHYFADKQELLLWTYQELAERALRVVDEAAARDPTDIVGALLALGAVGPNGIMSWRAYLALSDHATRNPELAALQRLTMQRTIERFCQILRTRHGDRDDLESVSERLSGLVQGISIQALLGQKAWSAERIREVIAAEVDAILGRPAAAPLQNAASGCSRPDDVPPVSRRIA